MKKIAALSLVLFLSAQTADSSFDTFWQAFKGAVSKHDVETIARLSKFPIGMSYGIPSVRTKAQLTRRYRQVFNEQSDAAACFAKAKPEVDAENPKHHSVACPDSGGNEVVIYHFEKTRMGWRFTGLDNINE